MSICLRIITLITKEGMMNINILEIYDYFAPRQKYYYDQLPNTLNFASEKINISEYLKGSLKQTHLIPPFIVHKSTNTPMNGIKRSLVDLHLNPTPKNSPDQITKIITDEMLEFLADEILKLDVL
ncbi:MAG: hypothetical protein ACRCTJ_05120 [Brevinema sp.]